MIRIITLLALCLPLVSLGQNTLDTLSLWNYELQPHAKTQKDRSLGLITFWRTKPIHDSVHLALHQELWTPQISFSIYPLADSVYCDEQSRKFKMSSSCMGPDVGGDMHRVGSFIFLNRDICLSCAGYQTKRDYCRPVIKQVLGAMDMRKVKTLVDLETHLGVKKGGVTK